MNFNIDKMMSGLECNNIKYIYKKRDQITPE